MPIWHPLNQNCRQLLLWKPNTRGQQNISLVFHEHRLVKNLELLHYWTDCTPVIAFFPS
jgi:hypothetical protein